MAVMTWSLLSVDDGDRQFGGNDGYDDVFGERYSYSSIVPNNGRVEAGHTGVVRNHDDFLGWGTIIRVTQAIGVVERKRCPACGNTGIKIRKTMKPAYRCDKCTAEFDDPTIDVVDGARVFVAEFGEDWMVLPKPMPVKENLDLYLKQAAQHAIRQIHGPLWVERALLGTGG